MFSLACGPVVGGVDGSGSADESDSGSTGIDTGDPATGPDDVATGTPIPEPRQDFSGAYLLAIAAVIAPETPLQWQATVVQDLNTGELEIELQPLSLDPLGTTFPREPVGDPRIVTANLGPDNTFVLDLGQVYVPGAANPITGSDIYTTLALDGVAFASDLWCGEVTGSVSAPLQLDLTGSTFAFTPITATGELPDPVVARCPE